MQTQISNRTTKIAALQHEAAELRGQIRDLQIELGECSDLRDADGCRLTDEGDDISYQIECLEAELETIEEQIEEARSECDAEPRTAILALRLDLQLTLRQPLYRTDTQARRQIVAQLREIEAQIESLSG